MGPTRKEPNSARRKLWFSLFLLFWLKLERLHLCQSPPKSLFWGAHNCNKGMEWPSTVCPFCKWGILPSSIYSDFFLNKICSSKRVAPSQDDFADFHVSGLSFPVIYETSPFFLMLMISLSYKGRYSTFEKNLSASLEHPLSCKNHEQELRWNTSVFSVKSVLQLRVHRLKKCPLCIQTPIVQANLAVLWTVQWISIQRHIFKERLRTEGGDVFK